MIFNNILFLFSTLLTLGGALGVTLSKRLMHSCVYLLTSLFGVAGLYATLGADFLAATQLVVYAGGVVILMIFAIMLVGKNENENNRFELRKTPGMGNIKTYIIGLASGILFLLIFLKFILGITNKMSPQSQLFYEPTVEKIGMLLATDHILAFEISSILLLGALIGASLISRTK